MNSERCACGGDRRAECPACGKFVRVVDGKLEAHDHVVCQGSHLEYRGCKQSGKKVGP